MGEAASGRPAAARWIVEFRARESGEEIDFSACNEHLAVGKRRLRVQEACACEVAGFRPGPTCRIVEFCGREKNTVAKTAGDEDHAIL